MNKKSIISYVMSFILAVSLGVCGLASGIYLGFLYSGSVQTAFTEIEGVDGVRQRVLEGIDYTNAPYGMDILVLEKIVTHDMIHEDVKSYIGSCLKGEQFELNEKSKKSLEDSYFSGIDYMLREKGIEITSEGDEAIRSYFNTFSEHYINAVQFEGVRVFAGLSKYSKVILIIAGALGAVAIVAGAALWILSTQRGKMFVFALLGAGTMIIALPGYMLANKAYLRIIGNSQLTYDFYVRMLRNGFANIASIGFILIILGIGTGIYQFLKKD